MQSTFTFPARPLQQQEAHWESENLNFSKKKIPKQDFLFGEKEYSPLTMGGLFLGEGRITCIFTAHSTRIYWRGLSSENALKCRISKFVCAAFQPYSDGQTSVGLSESKDPDGGFSARIESAHQPHLNELNSSSGSGGIPPISKSPR